jgi:hypothetical protein
MNDLSNLETLWENLLSRQSERVILAFSCLAAEEQSEIVAHLQRMSSEAGWHSEQQKSASAALTILKDNIE